MQEKINLVLKENLFSLENMLDIYNGSLTTLLIKCITLLSRHIDQCSVIMKFYRFSIFLSFY